MNLKKIIIDSLNVENAPFDLEKLVQITNKSENGDYSLPCFAFSKLWKMNPNDCANKIKEDIKENEYIEKIEVVNGYLNFYLNRKIILEKILNEFNEKNEEFFTNKEHSKDKVLCIDYSSVNLAKYMHIGHLSTTIIGECIARLAENLGFTVKRINYIGDYGTPFGKMVVAYKMWGNEKDIEKYGLDAFQDLYIKFSKEEVEHPELTELAREAFKKIENKDEETLKIYNIFIEKSMEELKRLTSLLGVKFDSFKGESYYSDKMQPTIDKLNNLNLLEESQGAKIVDLEKYKLGICMIQKSDGTSLYATRDITAAMERYEEYKYDLSFYVTAVEQKQHFASFFKVLDLMNEPCANKLEHIYYGMLRLPEGEISSRKGKQALLKDITNEAIKKAENVIENRTFSIENKKDVARKVGIGAINFSATCNERIKDSVFNMDSALNFDGETSPYMQYTYARCASILRKGNEFSKREISIDDELGKNPTAYELIKHINRTKEIATTAFLKREPSIVANHTMQTCKLFNKFYYETKILAGKPEEIPAKLKIVELTKNAIRFGLNLLVIETVEEM